MNPQTSPEATDFRVTPRFVLGMAIMLAGLVLALDSLGVVDGSAVFRFWPLAIIAVGIVKGMSPAREGSTALVWILGGLGLLLMTLGHLPPGRVWALILFFIGANIAWRAIRPSMPRTRNSDPSTTLDVVAFMGGGKRHNSSPEFKGGSLVAIMGGWEIDLRQASIASGEAVIDVCVVMGGGQIRVPEDWDVQIHALPFMGGIEDKTRPATGSKKRLVITGIAVMGGIEVKN